jgi:2-polyprenyl-3-methyl-5-hydroxy-6-metoxy-1,4-benzoquinol methylase
MRIALYRIRQKIKKKVNLAVNNLFQKNRAYNKYVFRKIYKKDLFNSRSGNVNPVSKSGSGSDIEQTREIIQALPRLFKKYNIKSILDVPCGDFYWMQHVKLEGINYTGGDIVSEIIYKNKNNYATNTINFFELDIVNDPLPKVDLIICRDLLVHLKNPQIIAALNNIKKSGSKYLLTTSFKNTTQNADNDKIGFWRPINIQLTPFNLTNPIDEIYENCTEANGRYNDKFILLFQIN